MKIADIFEAKTPSFTAAMMQQPKKIILGYKGYYLEFRQAKKGRAIYDLRRLITDSLPQPMYLTISKGGGAAMATGNDKAFMLQMHGTPIYAQLSYEQRTIFGPKDDVKLYDVPTIKNFVVSVLKRLDLD